MNDIKMEKYLDLVNDEKKKKNLFDYVPLYPMLRIENKKLFIGILLVHKTENVWDENQCIKPKFWVKIDPVNSKILEFNDTKNIKFLEEKSKSNKQKEISKYILDKTIEYKNYILKDLKSQDLPIQKKLCSILSNTFEIDGQKVNINDYIIANMEDKIFIKIDELVHLLVESKYNKITFYYDNIFFKIIEEYKNNNIIDKSKVKVCAEIMNIYYDGVVDLYSFFEG